MTTAIRGTILVTLCAVATFVTPLQAGDRMNTGQWDFTLTTGSSTHTAAHCVTREEAGAVNGPIASARKQAETNAIKGHCSVKTFAIRDETVSYALLCGPRVIESTAVYHGDRFDGVLTTTFEGKSTKTQVAARRTGACP